MLPRLPFLTGLVFMLAGFVLTLRPEIGCDDYAVTFLVLGGASLGFSVGWDSRGPEPDEY